MERQIIHDETSKDTALRAIYLPGFEDFDPIDFPWKEVEEKNPLPSKYELAKRSRSRLVLKFQRDGQTYFIKRIKARKFSSQISAAFLGSKAYREFQAALEFEKAGFKVPKPVFVAYGHLNYWSYLVTEGLSEDLVSLDEYLRHHELTDDLIEKLAYYSALLHESKLYHNDFRSDHFFMKETWSEDSLQEVFTMIDLDGATFGKKPSDKQRIEAIDELFLSLMRVDLVKNQAELFCDSYQNETNVKLDAEKLYEKAFQEYKEYHHEKLEKKKLKKKNTK